MKEQKERKNVGKKGLTKLKVFIAGMICLAALTACSKNNAKVKNEKLPDYFGPELENISCFVRNEGDYVEKSIYVMSRKDVEECTGSALYTSVEGTGGEFDYDIEYEKGDYKIDDYTLYSFDLKIENIKFDEDKVSINSIKIFDEDGKNVIFEFKPQKFEICKIEGEENNEYIEYMSTPLTLPRDYLKLMYEVEVEKKVKIKDIILSNEDLKLANINDLKNMEITKKSGTYEIDGAIKINENELSKYTEYVSTVVFKYEVDGEEYISFTPVKEIIYNPLIKYDENFKDYYNEVLLKK